jgi:hypothetical protein
MAWRTELLISKTIRRTAKRAEGMQMPGFVPISRTCRSRQLWTLVLAQHWFGLLPPEFGVL